MTLAGGRPILALDMYEHAYHMDFGAKAAAYVDAFMEGVRLEQRAALFERYSKEAYGAPWQRSSPRPAMRGCRRRAG